MEFNWEKFMNTSNKLAVHCKTEEEAIDFCKQMDEHGLKWRDGDNYLEINHWGRYKEETCYSNNGTYADLEFYKKENYTILEWSNYMKKGPIDYLEYGYVVELENGNLAMYMPSRGGDCFDYGCGCYSIFNNYTEDLKYWDSDYDVKRIYGYSKHMHKTLKFDIKDRTIIWERPGVKKMTVSEICEKLGYKVEIIAED